jgi:hypothetical protein
MSFRITVFPSPGRGRVEGRARHPQTFHRALLRAISVGSDNECYVNFRGGSCSRLAPGRRRGSRFALPRQRRAARKASGSGETSSHGRGAGRMNGTDYSVVRGPCARLRFELPATGLAFPPRRQRCGWNVGPRPRPRKNAERAKSGRNTPTDHGSRGSWFTSAPAIRE